MTVVALVALVDPRGRVLLQERDELAPTDPDRWSLVGGGVEAGESALDGARRELLEETGIGCDDLRPLGTRTLPCPVHGSDDFALFTALTTVTDDEVECHEGRQIVFVERGRIAGLELANATAVLLPAVWSAHDL